MSKISLKHSGGNVVSLNAPTNAPGSADVAFKLPNADGSAGQFMKTDGSGNLSFAAAGGGGKILQLKSTTKTDHFTHNTTTVTDITGLSVSITASSASNQIFIIADIFMSGGANTYAGFRLLRDTTAIRQTTAIDGTDNRFMGTIGSHTDQSRYVRSVGLNFLDTPGDTNPHTYKIAVATLYGSTLVHINRTGDTDNLLYPQAGSSTITVMEYDPT